MGFRSARKKAGLSTVKASKLLDVSRETLWMWESGKVMPRANRLSEIAKLYGVTVDELIREE